MKIKNLFCKTVLFSLGTILPAGLFSTDVKNDEETSNSFTASRDFTGCAISPITVTSDVVEITDQLWDAGLPNVASGVYIPENHQIKITYVTPKSVRSKIVEWCKSQNRIVETTVLRHEKEHARKVLLVKQNQKYSPLVRGRLAAMNEIMAPGGEIVEAADYHISHGDRMHPLRFRVYTADSLIQKRMKEAYPYRITVDYTDQVVASIVLRYATDSFFAAVGRGNYKTTIACAIRAPYPASVTPNLESDVFAPIMFSPQTDNWGPLFQYKTNGDFLPVDIWAHASEQERQRTLQKVDSLIDVINPAAKYMIVPPNAKTR